MASQPPSVDLYDGEEDQPTQARPSDAPTRQISFRSAAVTPTSPPP